MILTGSKIKEKVYAKEIIIDPFTPDQINPNSYDFRLGSTLLMYKEDLLDPKKENETETIHIFGRGL